MKLFSLIKEGDVHLAENQKKIPRDDYQTLVEAEEILEQAEADAEEKLQETKEECERLREQAKQEGMQEGLTQFNQQLFYLNDQIESLSLEMQQQVLPLALKAAKKIVSEELQTNPDTIVNIVQQAIRPVLASQKIKILVNKEDVPHLQKKREELKSQFERLENFAIEESAEVSRGSCIIETEVGIINATLENQWRAIEAAFEKFAKQT